MYLMMKILLRKLWKITPIFLRVFHLLVHRYGKNHSDNTFSPNRIFELPQRQKTTNRFVTLYYVPI